MAVFEGLGWIYNRTKGDHYILTKAGASRPCVVKMENDLGDDIISSCCRTAGIKAVEFNARLLEHRGKKKAKKSTRKEDRARVRRPHGEFLHGAASARLHLRLGVRSARMPVLRNGAPSGQAFRSTQPSAV